jgi:hypothetical protein
MPWVALAVIPLQRSLSRRASKLCPIELWLHTSSRQADDLFGALTGAIMHSEHLTQPSAAVDHLSVVGGWRRMNAQFIGLQTLLRKGRTEAVA